LYTLNIEKSWRKKTRKYEKTCNCIHKNRRWDNCQIRCCYFWAL